MRSKRVILILRRLVLPLLLIVFVEPWLVLLLLSLLAPADIPADIADEGRAIAMVAVPFFSIIAALVIVPAAYDVARFGWGAAKSLLALCVIGGVVGALPMIYFGLRDGDTETFSVAATFGAPVGLVTALIWTACNTDLFRRPTPQA